MAILCERIAKEQDPNKFTELVKELNNLLGRKQRRLRVSSPGRNNPV
jgi:hypothetical protein